MAAISDSSRPQSITSSWDWARTFARAVPKEPEPMTVARMRGNLAQGPDDVGSRAMEPKIRLTVTQFEDASDRNADGTHDWYYSGWYYVVDLGDISFKARR